MDNNTLAQQHEPVVPQTQGSSATESPKKGSSHMLLITCLIIIVLAIVLGAMWFMSNQRTSQDALGRPSKQQTQSQGDFASLEKDLNAIEVESNDKDFVDVDKDLQSL